MKFFIDTANLAQIQEAQDLGVLDGVTTNPSLMAKEGTTGKEAIFQLSPKAESDSSCTNKVDVEGITYIMSA